MKPAAKGFVGLVGLLVLAWPLLAMDPLTRAFFYNRGNWLWIALWGMYFGLVFGLPAALDKSQPRRNRALWLALAFLAGSFTALPFFAVSAEQDAETLRALLKGGRWTAGVAPDGKSVLVKGAVPADVTAEVPRARVRAVEMALAKELGGSISIERQ